MFEGSLDMFALPGVLRLVGQQSATGRLEIRRGKQNGSFEFLHGGVVRVQAGGAVSGDDDALLDAAAALLDGDGGHFSFTAGAVRDGHAWPVEKLLTAVDQRRAEWERLLGHIGSMDAAVTFVSRLPKNTTKVTLMPAEWSLVALADGRRSIAAIAREANVSAFRAATMFCDMIGTGLVEPPVNGRRRARPVVTPIKKPRPAQVRGSRRNAAKRAPAKPAVDKRSASAVRSAKGSSTARRKTAAAARTRASGSLRRSAGATFTARVPAPVPRFGYSAPVKPVSSMRATAAPRVSASPERRAPAPRTVASPAPRAPLPARPIVSGSGGSGRSWVADPDSRVAYPSSRR